MADDRKHFQDYRPQTEVKHTILEKYLFAYFNILKPNNKNLVYIDGFAGPGVYQVKDTGDVVEGSPLRALAKIASLPDLAQKVTSLFIEKDPVLAEQLQANVGAFYKQHPEIREPVLFVGAFAEKLKEALDRIEAKGGSLAPTFLFVDPCGVEGTSFEAIERFMKHGSCELLVFFNIDGIRRILGLDKLGNTLPELLGTVERAAALQAKVEALAGAPASQREEAIVSYYEELLRERTGAAYITSFGIEFETRRVTSHYLIHASKNPLGFTIMKDVMWGEGRTDEGIGGLEMQQSSISGTALMFTPSKDQLKADICSVLAGGPRLANYFYWTLASDPKNKIAPKAYRTALLELEAAGAIVVLAKDGSGTRAPKRKPNTLAKDYYVRLTTEADRAAVAAS